MALRLHKFLLFFPDLDLSRGRNDQNARAAARAARKPLSRAILKTVEISKSVAEAAQHHFRPPMRERKERASATVV